MALTPQNDEAFFREVDEDYRRDRLASFGRRWGRLIALGVVVVLLALAAALWWRGRRAAAAAGDAERLTAVLADAEQNRARARDPRLTALAEAGRPGYRALARLTEAGITAASDPAAAAGRYRAIADDASLPQPLRDLALIRATTLGLDTLPPAEVIRRLRPLAQPGGPWFGSAGELTGAAYLRMNRRDLAGPLFAAIARDAGVPGSLRARAAGMASALGQTVGTIAPTGTLKE